MNIMPDYNRLLTTIWLEEPDHVPLAELSVDRPVKEKFMGKPVRDIPSEVCLSTHDGMPRDCAINCDHIQTVSRGKIGRLITTLPSEKMKQVREAILFALGL